MTTTPVTPQTDLPLSEVIDSMTGFDEIAAEKFFDGFNVYDAVDTAEGGRPRARDMVTLLRVGVFILKRRDGLSDKDAYDAAMSMPSRVVNGYFADDPEEIDADDPDTEPGKDSSAPA